METTRHQKIEATITKAMPFAAAAGSIAFVSLAENPAGILLAVTIGAIAIGSVAFVLSFLIRH